MSGIVRNPLDGSFWVHNDSGDEPRLFALDAEGRVQIPESLGDDFHGEEAETGKEPWPGVFIENAANQDWEDVTSDGTTSTSPTWVTTAMPDAIWASTSYPGSR